MDKSKHMETVLDRINREIEALSPHGEGRASSARVKRSLESVAAVAFREGQRYALSSLMTVDDVAEKLGVSARRVRAIAKAMHERYGVGWQAPGTGVWLFRPEDIDILRPGPEGRPRGGREVKSQLYAVYEEYETGWWRRIAVAKTPDAAQSKLEAEQARRQKQGYSMFQSRLVLMDAPPAELHESELPEAVRVDEDEEA